MVKRRNVIEKREIGVYGRVCGVFSCIDVRERLLQSLV